MHIHARSYQQLLDDNIELPLDTPITFIDYLGGFSSDYRNDILDYLDKKQFSNKINTQYIIGPELKNNYPRLDLNFSVELQHKINFQSLEQYHVHPDLNFKNFVCSFNGSQHVSRRLLVSILNRFGYFDTEYCSKNFSYSANTLDGHVEDFVGDRIDFYRKFFISDNSEDFFQTIYSFGHVRFDHGNNIRTLENKITQSFLHIVSETVATSYYPFVTEKFLYSVVTRGLFVCYAQPQWHQHVEKYYGFKQYNKLFDYRFDAIQNTVERLVELMTMISKFRMLTPHEWHDLYLIERDTIEYNYEHYRSGDYLKCLRQYREC